MPETPQSKRLNGIFSEYKVEGDSTRSFAKLIGTSQSSLRRMMKGEQPITQQVIKTICTRLGYSPEWFINGTGAKKKKGDDVKLITEISMLRTEIDLMLQMNKQLQARMAAYEQEIAELKNKVKGER